MRNLVRSSVHIYGRCRFGSWLSLAAIISQAGEDFRKDKSFLQRKFFLADHCRDWNPWVVPIEENFVKPFQLDTIASHGLSIEPSLEHGKDSWAAERLHPTPTEEVVYYTWLVFEPSGNLLLPENFKLDVMLAQLRLCGNDRIGDLGIFDRMRGHDLESLGFVPPFPLHELGDGFFNVARVKRRYALALINLVASGLGEPHVEINTVLLLSANAIQLCHNHGSTATHVTQTKTFKMLP